MQTTFSRKPSMRTLAFGVALLVVGASAALARHHHRTQTDSVAGQFDYYLLSLSWSPAYCLTHAEDRAQCGSKGLGFVLHGLWPQYDSGGYPQNCTTDNTLTGEARSIGRSIYPSPKLVSHEWDRHGTCSGLSAVDYFHTADRSAAAIKIPAMFEAPAANLQMSSGQILDAFRAANPGLPQDSLAVECSQGQLSEMRVCLTRDLKTRSCGRGVRSNCRDTTVQIRSSR
jgi:ribonuclease T2